MRRTKLSGFGWNYGWSYCILIHQTALRALLQPLSPLAIHSHVGQDASQLVTYCVRPHGQKHLYEWFLTLRDTWQLYRPYLFRFMSLMNSIHLLMYKWSTNSTHLKDIWWIQSLSLQTETHVLGMDWDTQCDTIHIDHTDITRAITELPATKCKILKVTSGFYDPLGQFSLVAPAGKLLFQDTWTRGLAWDEILPPDIAVKWLSWISITSLVWHARSTMDRSKDAQITGLRGTCFRRYFWTCIRRR